MEPIEGDLVLFLGLLKSWHSLGEIIIAKRQKRRKRRRWWVKPHITVPFRNRFGAYHKLFTYFKWQDHDEFFEFTRMSVPQFEKLHALLAPSLEKHSQREPLPTELRLAVTLW